MLFNVYKKVWRIAEQTVSLKNEVSRLVYLNVMTIIVMRLIVILVHDFGLVEQPKHVAIGPLQKSVV